MLKTRKSSIIVFMKSSLMVAMSVILVGSLAGCSQGSAEELQIPEKNIDQWLLPLDQFEPKKVQSWDYAELLLQQGCMKDRGNEFNVPWRSTDDDPGLGWNDVGLRLFDEDIASQYGYHIPPPPEGSHNPEWDRFNVEVNNNDSPKFGEDFDACLAEARKKLPDDGDSMSLASGLTGSASDAALASKEVVKTIEDWRFCMLPQGVSDLPEMPDEMPSESITSKFGIMPADDSPVEDYAQPSAEEIELAVADAKCQQSSGYRQTYYDTWWDESIKLYEENADDLIRAKKTIADRDAAAQKIINEIGPSQP